MQLQQESHPVTGSRLSPPLACQVWDTWITRLFKGLCTSRVSTAHRTRGSRRALTAAARLLLSDAVCGVRDAANSAALAALLAEYPVLGQDGALCRLRPQDVSPEHGLEDCTFAPNLCKRSLSIAKITAVCVGIASVWMVVRANNCIVLLLSCCHLQPMSPSLFLVSCHSNFHAIVCHDYLAAMVLQSSRRGVAQSPHLLGATPVPCFPTEMCCVVAVRPRPRRASTH
jgi:hypothetical protein